MMPHRYRTTARNHRHLLAAALLVGGCSRTVHLGAVDDGAGPDGGGGAGPDGGGALAFDTGDPYADARARPDVGFPAVDRPPAEVTMPDEYPDGARCPAGMALVAGGAFDMGLRQYADPVVDYWPSRPLHGVRVSDFCIDLTEVTVGAYRRCVSGAGCTAAAAGNYCNWDATGREDHPINCVTWEQAMDHCQRRGATLPTEAQWEYAARGTDGRLYPWGNDGPFAQLCWNGALDRGSTCPVGSYPAGRSPFGLSDMAGNVMEYAADWYGSYDDLPVGATLVDPTGPAVGVRRVVRDSHWSGNNPYNYRSAVRGQSDGFHPEFSGFRCARAAR